MPEQAPKAAEWSAMERGTARMWENIQKVNKLGYQPLRLMLDHLSDAGMTDERKLEILRNFILQTRQPIKELSLQHQLLATDKVFDRVVRHDMGSKLFLGMTAQLYLLEKISETSGAGSLAKLEQYARLFCKKWAEYALLGEDIIFRKMEIDDQTFVPAGSIIRQPSILLPGKNKDGQSPIENEANYSVFDPSLANDGLSSFFAERQTELPQFSSPFGNSHDLAVECKAFPSIPSGRQIKLVPGVAFSGMENIIKNCCNAVIDASRVCFDVLLEEDVMRIMFFDDGVGMCAEKLPTIFEPGRSYRQSSGLGLDRLDAHLAMMGITLNVVTRPRGEPSQEINFYNNLLVHRRGADPSAIQLQRSRLEKMLSSGNYSTIFEMVFPITLTTDIIQP